MSLVYVQNKKGKPLMPTQDNRLVRILLSEKKAKVVRMSPFTIRLKIRTKEYRQKIVLGIDAGSKHVGVSACTETEELFCAEMQPRNDVVELLSTRRELRRSRRNKKSDTGRLVSIIVRTASTRDGWRHRLKRKSITIFR
jgi:N6-L-threonylcarbamoyladenine synthase